MVRPGTGTKYVTSVFYSGTPDAELDTFVGSVAKINRGKWSSSGCNHTSGARDMFLVRQGGAGSGVWPRSLVNQA